MGVARPATQTALGVPAGLELRPSELTMVLGSGIVVSGVAEGYAGPSEARLGVQT